MLKLKNISKSYNDETRELLVLNNVSFEVKDGEIITIFGKSGIGKSTLIKVAGGLMFPDSGMVELNDINLYTKNTLSSNFRSKHFGYIFQSHCLLPELTIIENLLVPVYIHNLDIKKSTSNIMSYLELLDLKDIINSYPNKLSFRENQRISIIRSLVGEPLIVFADEPTGNLDENNSNIILELFVKLNKQYNYTFIIGTHDEKFATISDKCYKIINKNLKEL